MEGNITPDMLLYMEERERSLARLILGKEKGGAPSAEERVLLSELRCRLKKN